jgi:hypothetical protein
LLLPIASLQAVVPRVRDQLVTLESPDYDAGCDSQAIRKLSDRCFPKIATTDETVIDSLIDEEVSRELVGFHFLGTSTVLAIDE